MKKSEITGAVGAVPPPDAPIENAMPLAPETIQVQQDRAAANEKVLPPFNPKPMGRTAPASVVPAVAAADLKFGEPVTLTKNDIGDATALLIADVFGTDAPKAVSELAPALDPVQEVVDQLDDVLPALTPEDRARMPAASATDTPAKGLLPNLTPPKGDKFEGVQRGGFSDLADAQYFPLQGDELRELVLALFDDMADRIKNDLRFSMALTYPRVRAIVEIRIEGHAEDNNAGFEIRKILAPKDGEKGGTPDEIASQRADQVVFVVRTLRQEFTPEGESDHPPDAMRDELGLSKPRKQIIETNTGQRFVDVVSPGSDAAALTR